MRQSLRGLGLRDEDPGQKDVAQGRQKAAAIAQQLPTSYVVKQDVGGMPQDVRRLTVAVYERAI
jgi:hypothetical protein